MTAGPTAPRTARYELARRTTSYLTDDVRNDALLAISEIVTNAIRHGDVRDGDSLTIGIDPTPGRVAITVEQTTAVPSVEAGYEPTEDGGMGLAIVDKLADAWGVENGPPGRVWFVVVSD